MIKVFALIPSRTDIPLAEFHDHWRHPHAAYALRITTLLGYVQCHRVGGPGPGLADTPYEGIAEVWFEDLATAAGMGEDPNYSEYCGKDEPEFIDIDNLAFLMSESEVLVDGGPDAGGTGSVKLLQLIKATGEWATDEDQRLGAALGAMRHVRSRASADAYADAVPPFDGIRELSWPSRAAFDAAAEAAPDAWRTLLAAPAGVGAGSVAMLASENLVLWPVTEKPIARPSA